jgi:outer membrane protein TolC
MKKYILTILFLFHAGTATGQKNVDLFTLQQAYEQLEQSWPLGRKAELQSRITQWNRRIAGAGLLPEVRLNGSMSYRSDVTEVPFSVPGTEPPEFSRDHYNFSLDVNQTLFDGGRTRFVRESEKHTGAAEQARIRAEFLSVREQMEQVWYGILMMQKQEEVLELLHDDITEQLGMVESQVRNGVLLPGDEMLLRAELIRVEQDLAGTRGDIRAGYGVLSEILGEYLSPESQLETPDTTGLTTGATAAANRPEYDLFEANEQRLESQKKLSGADMLPSVSLFATSAYGRPGLNVFDDDLQLYWIVGVRAQWSFRNTRNASIKKDVIELQKRAVDADRDIFIRQLQASLRKTEAEIEAIRKQIEQDREVLSLRSVVVAEKLAQLEQGAITSTEYITQLNAESRARVNLEIRKIRLAQELTEYRTKQGLSWN